MLGMDLLFDSMGVDKEKLQQNIDGAVAHVKSIDERMARLEQAIVLVLGKLDESIKLSHTIIDEVERIRIDSPPISEGFVEQFETQNVLSNQPEQTGDIGAQVNGSGKPIEHTTDNGPTTEQQN